jgi:hypothetical protein
MEWFLRMMMIPKPDPVSDLRRCWSSFQTEVQEFQVAASRVNIFDMDYTRSLAHACLDRYLDAIGTGYAVEAIRQQNSAQS